MGDPSRQRSWIWILIVGLGAVVAALWGARRRREVALQHRRLGLVDHDGGPPFDPDLMLEGVPAPGQRYLRHAIAPGTPLARTVRLVMGGQIRLGAGAWYDVEADEILSIPGGFVWQARARRGPVVLRGYDAYERGTGEMRWWLWGVFPMVSASSPGLSRSAAGRLAIEAIWLPSAMLPLAGATWEPLDDDRCVVVLDIDGLTVRLTLEVDADGRLVRVTTARWRPEAEPPDFVSFGADTITEERTFGGYTLPTRLRVGWELDGRNRLAFFQPVVKVASFR